MNYQLQLTIYVRRVHALVNPEVLHVVNVT